MKQILVILVIFVVVGCESAPVDLPRSDEIQLLDNRENYEAEAAALWVSGDLRASEYYYSLFDVGLSLVREEFGDSIPEVSWIYFDPPWVPGLVTVKLTDDAISQLRNGQPTCIDSLNSFFDVVEVDTSFIEFNNVTLRSSERYHSERMAEFYVGLDCVVSASAKGYGHDNSWDLYPWVITGGSSYLFRFGWGDCPSWCNYHNFWYFRVIGDSVEYVGVYNTETDPEPSWWVEARRAYDFSWGDLTGIK